MGHEGYEVQFRTIQKTTFNNHNHVSSFLWFSISELPPKKVGHRQQPASCSTQSYLFHAPCLSPSLPQLRSKGATVLHITFYTTSQMQSLRSKTSTEQFDCLTFARTVHCSGILDAMNGSCSSLYFSLT